MKTEKEERLQEIIEAWVGIAFLSGTIALLLNVETVSKYLADIINSF